LQYRRWLVLGTDTGTWRLGVLLPGRKWLDQGQGGGMTGAVISGDPAARILNSARRMRDFGLLQPMDGFADLVGALRAYETKTGDAPEELEKLQLAISRVGASFEPETLSALLREELRLPTDAPQPMQTWKNLALFVPISLGFLFLFGSLYYTRLAIEGAGLAAKMNAVLAVDIQAKSDSIVAMLRPLLPSGVEGDAADLLEAVAPSGGGTETTNRAAAEALRALEDLKFHVVMANELMNQIQPTNRMFGYNGLRRGWPKVGLGKIEKIESTQGTIGPQAAIQKSDPADADPEVTKPQEIHFPATYPALADYNGYLAEIRSFAYSSNGPALVSPQHLTMVYSLERDELLANIEITNKWMLPVLYGALGAVLYVLARHFNPFAPSLSLARVALRITFAMFVAVTISMLFVPTNVMSPTIVSTPSGIFLLCFIAGYSTDTFIRFLSKLNTYFAMPAARPATS
jgi:hypothetical protein